MNDHGLDHGALLDSGGDGLADMSGNDVTDSGGSVRLPMTPIILLAAPVLSATETLDSI